MFFTITSIKNIVIDVDDFLPDHQDLLSDIISRLKALRVVLVTQKKKSELYTDMPWFAPSSSTEALVFQNVIRKALIESDAKPSNTVFITAGPQHLRHACELLLGTIVFLHDNISDSEQMKIFQSFPDFLLKSVEQLDRVLSGNAVGYAAEYFATPKECRLFSVSQPKLFLPSVPNAEHPDCPIHIGGRYFSAQDPRYSLHSLSVRLVNAKNKPEVQAQVFGNILGMGINYAVRKKAVNHICCVPPRPGEQNRIASFLNAIKDKNLSQHVQPDLIKCVTKYPKLKNLPANRRRDAVRNVFEVSPEVRGKTVLVVDDIRTTGSTLNEAISTLKNAGAEFVIPIVIGYHPFANQSLALSDEDQLRCKYCDGFLIPRIRNQDGQPFYGCSKWSEKTQHTSLDFAASIKAKLQRIEPKLLAFDDELASDTIDF